MDQERSQLVEELKIRVRHGSRVGKAVVQLLCDLSRDERALRDFLGLPLSQSGDVSLGAGKLVKLSGLQGHVYASDFMAINLPSTSVLTNLQMD